MRKFLIILAPASVAVLFLTLAAVQDPVPQKASVNETVAGVNNTKFVTPYGLSRVASNGFSGGGSGITNVLERNITSTTNTWGGTVVVFGADRFIRTNMAGDLTLSGISGFTTSNFNWTTLSLDPNGATRLLTIPADWWASGFTNATTVAITNGTKGRLQVDAVIGFSTNAALTIYQ